MRADGRQNNELRKTVLPKGILNTRLAPALSKPATHASSVPRAWKTSFPIFSKKAVARMDHGGIRDDSRLLRRAYHPEARAGARPAALRRFSG